MKVSSTQADNALQRASRLFQIVTIVFSSSPGSTLGRDELSFSCGCDIRTISRDMKILTKAGIPIEYDSGARAYTLPDKNWTFPIARLTPQDALALALARGLLAAPGVPHRADLLSVLDKATASLPPALRQLLTEAAAAVRPALPARDYSHAPVEALLEAAAMHQGVEIDYESASSHSRTWRRIDPYVVELRSGQFWELHGWDPVHGEIRTFALDRVFGMREAGETFSAREAEWAAFAGAKGIIGGLRGGALESVDIVFATPVAVYALAHLWPKGLHCTPQPDGSARLIGEVQGLDGIIPEMLRWRRHAEVLGGPNVRERMHDELRAMLALYDPPAS